jgi:5-methylcytosine-specific restriction enzyme subunit McrC
MASPIPILNAYYLFLYAWDLFREGRSIDIGTTDRTDLPNLFAKVLESGTKRLLRRGLDRGYQEIIEETSAPRGRFLLADTIKRASLTRVQAVCSYDQLSADIPRNQILKATLRKLSFTDGIQKDIAHELRILLRKLSEVSDVPLSRALFRHAQLTRNSRHYDLLLHVCRIVLDHLLPGEGQGHARFRDILEDEVRMSHVFEAFVRNFYRGEQRFFSVGAPKVPWNIESPDPSHAQYVPDMRTDVALCSANRTIIIDTKFYKEVLVTNRWGSRKLRSEHLYQILTYMRHSAEQDEIETEGILLYADTGRDDLHLDYAISNQRLRVRTLHLDRPWAEIHNELLDLVGLNPPTTVGTLELRKVPSTAAQ